MQHLLSMNEVTHSHLNSIFTRANEIKDGTVDWAAKGTFAANIFLEASTRTKNSFYIAERRLGIDVVDVNGSDSSLTKGESLKDTLKALESIGVQLVVLRQPEQGVLQDLSEGLNLSIINAGDGTGEHPTQSLLDLYTISQEFSSFKDLHVTIAGDIKHSRVARSNAHALKKLGAKVSFAAPVEWQDESLSSEYISMDEAVEVSDVLMLLRVQCERHEEQHVSNKDYLSLYGLTVEREARMKRGSIILHPAPVNRGIEIDDVLVECERSRIFDQMSNGVAVRMAIIQKLLEGDL
ncbi:aspartate carbamoyltransferase catalytic subunit [Halobacillus campisalis]|uniref:Aspartate carbamoyltransferase n=1 Tax=Halobacillus campisalis TaxID=435909 RepID=A0ABW2K0W7_9BACI|nr:aspartate carbamoyltransferase catalytic subunit [Halobacillus campisalis]